MATIKDVARRADVSPSTVSKYMNGGNVREENAEAIRRAIRELDFRVNPFARGLKTQRSRSIGILLPNMTAPFYGAVVMALDKCLREQGYHSLIACYSSQHGLERDQLIFLLNNGIDCLIYVPEDLSSEEYYELTANSTIPVVQVDRMIQGVVTDAVVVENTDAVHRAVNYLVEQGHRRIALISGPKSVFSAKERQVGYLRALNEHGIVYDDALAITEENTFAAGYRGGLSLLRLPNPPTAILTTNYDITLGLITALREQNVRIGEDVAVFGFDCVEVCTMLHPPLPVVHQPEEQIGQVAAQYLIQRLQGFDGESSVTRLPCRLVLSPDGQ